jgi:hypothetical protein
VRAPHVERRPELLGPSPSTSAPLPSPLAGAVLNSIVTSATSTASLSPRLSDSFWSVCA